jgi:hypothetical protein
VAKRTEFALDRDFHGDAQRITECATMDTARDATDHAKSEHKRPKDIEQPEGDEDRNVA